MVDVFHAMFEEDYTPRWEHEMDVRSKIRTTMYQTLYQEEYKWGVSTETVDPSMSMPAVDGEGRQQPRPAPRFQRLPSEGLAASAVNPETGTLDLPEGTKRADPAKSLPRVQSATPMEDLGAVLGQPLG